MRHLRLQLVLIVFSLSLFWTPGASAQEMDLAGGTWRRSDGLELTYRKEGDRYLGTIVAMDAGAAVSFKTGEMISDMTRTSPTTFGGKAEYRNWDGARYRGEWKPLQLTFTDANSFTDSTNMPWKRVGAAGGAAVGGAGNAGNLELEGTWKRVIDEHVVRFTKAGNTYTGTIVEPGGVGTLFKAGEKTFELARTAGNTFDGKILWRSGDRPEEWREDKITMQDADHFTDVGGAWVRVGARPAQVGVGGGGGLELEGTWRRTVDGLVLRVDRNGNSYTGTLVDPAGMAILFKAGEKTFEGLRSSANTFAGKSEHRSTAGWSEWKPETLTMQDADHFTDIRNEGWVRVKAMLAQGGTGGAAHACEKTFAKTWDPTTWGKFVVNVQGGSASGTYSSRYNRLPGGTFEGTVTGNTLQANWKDADGEGTLTLTLTDDGCTFSGKHTVTRGGGPGGANGAGAGSGAGDPGGRDAGMANAGGLVDGLPGGDGGACHDPEAQKCIQKWMDLMVEIRNRRDKSPLGQGGPWRFSEYGTLLGHSVIAAYAPDGWETKYKKNKYCVVWEIWQQAHLDPLHGNELPALRDFVRGCYATAPRPAAVATGGAGAPGTGAGGTASSAAPGQVPDVSAMTLYAEQRRVPAGERVSLPIWLLRSDSIANVNFTAGYDPAVVRIEGDIAKGNLLGDALFSVNAGETALARLGFAQRTGVTGSGTAGVISFRAVGKPGTRTPITLAVTAINNAAGASPRIELLHGEILIVGADGMVPGDSDGDGRVSELDALIALKMSVKLLEPSLTLDLDADRQVTSRDSVLILQQAVQPR